MSSQGPVPVGPPPLPPRPPARAPARPFAPAPAPLPVPDPARAPGSRGPSQPASPKPPRPPKKVSDSIYLRADLPEEVPAAPIAFAMGVLAFVLYALTCSRFVMSEDVAEFQALAAAHGIAHAGYPLYLLLLEGFHLLPILTAPWRANLTSALAAAIAVGLTAAVAVRYTRNLIAAVAAAGALALSYSLWHDATRAEIYAFTLALSAGALLSFSYYLESRHVDPLALCGILLGLSLTAHLGSLALAAVIVVVLLADAIRGRSPWAHVAIALATLVVGLLPLLLIPLRDTPGNPMNYIAYTFDEHSGRHIPWATAIATRLKRAWLLLSGAQYLEGGRFHPFQDAFGRARMLGWNLALNDLPGIGLLLAAAGGVMAVVRRRALDVLLVAWLGCLTFLYFYAAYSLSATSFFLPGTMALALLAARGVALIPQRVWYVALVPALAVIAVPWVRLRTQAPPAPLAGTSAAAAWKSWPGEWSPFTQDRTWEEYGRGVLASLPQRAHVLACWEEGTTLLAVQRGLDLRRDVSIHLSCDSPGRIRTVMRSAARSGTRVFTTIQPRRLGAPREWVVVKSWRRGGLWRHQPGGG